MAKKDRVNVRRAARELSFDEWIGGENGLKYATREQVVAFHNYALREQIVPIIRSALQEYDTVKRAERWYRRLWAWLTRPFYAPMNREQALAVLAAAQEAQLKEEEEARDEVAEAAGGNGEVRRSCVVCGSLQLEPVNERGGLQCANGHRLEDPPAETGA